MQDDTLATKATETTAEAVDPDPESDLRPGERHVLAGPAPKREAKRAFDEAVLERLVALNTERAAEEARGHIRWLRPKFQNSDFPREREPEQVDLSSRRAVVQSDTDDEPAPVLAGKPEPWPKDTVEQVRAVAEVLTASPVPLSVDEIAARFTARGP